ncbi:MAG: succinylglutamate desuccinylase/aspartoacylase family protein [Burkholderiales bacterium]|nr:succinylglutamate desuccinylase/aspartoacylase family protein [Burkholderiales bacterium]
MTTAAASAKTAAPWVDQPEGHFFKRIEIARMLTGAMVSLPLHVLTGRQPGPTLGVTCMVHGDEPQPSVMIREMFSEIDTAKLKGRLAVTSVSNSLAMAAFNRQSPEQHGKTDMHEAFPGSAKGNFTQRLANAISKNLLDHVDALLDFHSGGSGGRLQNRCGFNGKAPEEVRKRSIELCRAFGTPLIQESSVPGSGPDYVNTKGIPSVGGEIGGCYLGPHATDFYRKQIKTSLKSLMAELGMLPGEQPVKTQGQILFPLKAKAELRPTHGGFLVSFFESPSDIGKYVTKGTKLGEVIDLHSWKVQEELVAPFDGHIFFSRYSGIIEGGTQGFAVIDASLSKILD